MSDYDINDYGIFSNAVSTTKSYNSKIEEAKTTVSEVKTSLGPGVFEGPIADNCSQELGTLDTDLTGMSTNFTTISNFIIQTSQTYKKGDADASSQVLNLDGTTSASLTTLTANGNAKSSVTIPDSVNQAAYTVTCYGTGGWYLGGGSKATSVASGTKQKSVHEAWLADGARYKNGIAVMNVNGVDHYLIATAPTLGSVGDSVDVKLKNGQTVPCVIADAKSTHDSNYTTYGHGRSDGSVNVLEFEVDRNVYNSKGNPKTSTWNLEWDSSSGVSRVDNYGSVV